MKKLLALLLLTPLVVSEEVEYPIELTCEVASNIIQINLSDIDNESWLLNISASSALPIPGQKDKKLKIKKFRITENEITVKQRINAKFGTMQFSINRYSGGIAFYDAVGSQGKCTKGFKEYNEKQI